MQKNIKAAFIIIPIFFVLSGCMHSQATYNTNQGQVPTTTISQNTAINAARTTSSTQKGRIAGRGSGASMAPLYGDNTVIVTHPIEFEDLEAGMIVAYTNKKGTQVVHQITQKQGSSWIAKGLNNKRIDTERITSSNLIGVVYATFQAQNQ